MPDIKNKSHGTQPPPAATSSTGHPLPRRASPENSVTLRHHRLAREASLRGSPGRAGRPAGPIPSDVKANPTASPRRNSSGESHHTGQSDAKKWFDSSNQNAAASFSQTMDVDPPFYQKETDSSNEDLPRDLLAYPYHLRAGAPAALKPAVTQSSSTDDYRSVIDDLTIEIQRLKEELKRYKQLGPDLLKREKLFEIKVHGLPKRKKRELEATLRDFAAGLEETPSADTSSARKKSIRHANRIHSNSGSMSKHASSSSGSNSRLVDSAYASMSTGPNSSGTSLGRPSVSSRSRSSQQKVESYLNDIPEGLYPRHMVMTNNEKMKLVVRRLEQLFTGKMMDRNLQRNQAAPPAGSALAPVVAEPTAGGTSVMHQPPSLQTPGQQPSEPAREARILAPDAPTTHKKTRSRDNASTSNSNGDQTESGGNGAAAGEANGSPPNGAPPEQRPTNVRDLDPNRTQVPSENMEYIRHLGLVPPELLSDPKVSQNVAPDAEGWVYLNLLCSMAQLHMINVTPDFIRDAVAEKSTKFQMSTDGRKIRWRGGSDGTRFSSDSSGDNSHRSPSADETDGSNKAGQRKKHKTAQKTSGDDFISAPSSKNPSKLGPQMTGSSDSFHYKPLFAHQSSSVEQTSQDDTNSSFGQPAEESNVGESRWGMSGSGSSQRKKRRLDGAIIYYSGAPFCTDLSGDPGDISPATYMASAGRGKLGATDGEFIAPAPPTRTMSGSALRFRPLIDESFVLTEAMEVDPDPLPPGLTSDDTDEGSDFEATFPWSNSPQRMQLCELEPCGLGGVLPDDHFMVMVTTKRPKDVPSVMDPKLHHLGSDETTDSIIQRLATMSTSASSERASLPAKTRNATPSSVEINYVSGRIKRLIPVSLPPPVTFFPPFSTDESASTEMDLGSEPEDEDEVEPSEEFMSRRANPHLSDNTYPDNEDITSGDEEGEEPDEEDELRGRIGDEDEADEADKVFQLPVLGQTHLRRSSSSAIAAPGTTRDTSESAGAPVRTGSSVATAGDRESGYSSSVEESG